MSDTIEPTDDAIVFERDLNEVKLLLDHVSGQTDKSLEGLRIADENDPTKQIGTRAIMERIAGIRYPAGGGPVTPTASDAAFLLVIKDQLNGLASPARGLTIAYTTLFVGASQRHAGLWEWLQGLFRRPAEAQATQAAGLARQVYPGLASHARWFRWSFAFLVVIGLPLWLGLTAITYWDAALGRSVLQRFDNIEQQRQALFQTSPDLAHPETCSASPKPEQRLACAKLEVLRQATKDARIDLGAFRRCDDHSVRSWLHVMHWGFTPCRAKSGTDGIADEHMESDVLSVYSAYILPMMFGLLGTMIAAIRKIQDQIAKSELHPRDFLLTALLVPMGAVAAVAVGLFFSPTGAGLSGAEKLSGSLSLTAGGIGFLAGYGSPAFFALMDELLKQVFRIGKPAPKDPPATPA